jgi:hypothetical protein
MENLSYKAKNISHPRDFIRIGDLSYFEGPLLALFEDAALGHLYLFDWVDRSTNQNRWLVYRITPESLFSFISKQVSHADLMASNPTGRVYVTDIDVHHRNGEYILDELNEIPSQYFPAHDSMFDIADCPSYQKIHAVAMRTLFRRAFENELRAEDIVFRNFDVIRSELYDSSSGGTSGFHHNHTSMPIPQANSTTLNLLANASGAARQRYFVK